MYDVFRSLTGAQARAVIAAALCAGFLAIGPLATGYAQPAAPSKTPIRGVADIGVLEDRSRFIAVMQGGVVKAGREATR